MRAVADRRPPLVCNRGKASICNRTRSLGRVLTGLLLASTALAPSPVAGQLNLNGGSLTVSAANIGPVFGNGTISNGQLTVSPPGATSFQFGGNLIDGTGTLSLRKVNSGTLILSGTNSYSGSTFIGAGTLVAGAAGALSSASAYDVRSTLDLGGFAATLRDLEGTNDGVITNAGAMATLTLTNGSDTIYRGAITGSIALVKAGAGELLLRDNNGASNFTGGVSLQQGTLTVQGATGTGTQTIGALGTGTITVTGSGATLKGVNNGQLITIVNDVVLGNNNLTYQAVGAQTLAGRIGGNGRLIKTGTGTLTLANGGNSFVDGSGVSLQIANGAVQAASSGAIGTGRIVTSAVNAVGLGLNAPGDVTLGNRIQIGNRLDLTAAQGSAGTLFLTGIISGAELRLKADGGTIALMNPANSFTGGTGNSLTMISGFLGVGARTALGGVTTLDFGNAAGNPVPDVGIRAFGDLSGGNALDLTLRGRTPLIIDTNGNAVDLTGTVAGVNPVDDAAVALIKTGAGTLTLSGAAKAYGGGTTVKAGTLVLAQTHTGNLFVQGGLMQVLDDQFGNATVSGGTLEVDAAATITGSLVQNAGTARVAGGWAGPANVTGGTLEVTGYIDGDVTIGNGATLTGTGTVADGVLFTVTDGGRLSPGVSGVGTLTVGNLVLQPTSRLAFDLGAPGTGDRLVVNGNLQLGGVLDVVARPGFGRGSYQLIDYGLGVLTGSNPMPGTMPLGWDYAVASGGGFVTLDVLNANLWWNGSVTTANNSINGGNGVWQAGTTSWTDATGALTSAYVNDFATKATLAGSDGSITLVGEQKFARLTAQSNYVLTDGGAGALATAGGVIDVAAARSLDLGVAITGSGGIVKQGAGTLVLGAANGFTGGFTIAGGTVAVGNDLAFGNPANTITATAAATLRAAGSVTIANNGTFGGNTLAVDSNNQTLTLSGNLTGVAALTKQGDGVLVLGGTVNGFAAATTVARGTLATADVATLGGQGLVIENGATLRADADLVLANGIALAGTPQWGRIDTQGHTVTLDAAVTGGAGAVAGNRLVKVGGGTLVLGAANSHGNTDLAGGTIVVGNDAALADGTVAMADGTRLKTLADRSLGNAVTLAGIGNIDVADATTLAIAGVLTGGTGTSLVKQGQGTLRLSNTGNGLAAIAVDGGTLVLANPAARGGAGLALGGNTVLRLGTSAGGTDFALGPVAVNGAATVALLGTSFVPATLATDGNNVSFGAVTGSGDLTFSGAGRIAFGGNMAGYSGNVALGTGPAAATPLLLAGAGGIGSGRLVIRSGGLANTGGAAVTLGNAVDLYGPLWIGGTGDLTLAGTVAAVTPATAIVTKTGSGTLTLDSAQNSFQGLVLNDGAIRATKSGALGGAADVTLIDGAGLIFDGTGLQFANNILSNGGYDLAVTAGSSATLGGTGRLYGAAATLFRKTGDGMLTIAANNGATFTGAFDVEAGTLALANGTLGGGGTIAAGAVLAGTGGYLGSVTVADGATLSPGGAGVGALGFGSLTLGSGTNLAFNLAAPGPANDRIVVSNSLTLGGNLNVTAGAGFGQGAYTLFEYGTLAPASPGLTLGTLPLGWSYSIVTGGGLVQLVVAGGALYWNGSVTVANNQVNGGDGVWTAGVANWTDAGGAFATPYVNSHGTTAVLAGAAGTITVEGEQRFGTLRVEQNYGLVAGTSGTLDINAGTIDVAGGVTATVAAPITGIGGLTKTGAGTLVLAGDNRFSGGFAFGGGGVAVGSDAAFGVAGNGLAATTGAILLAAADATIANAATLGGNSLDVDTQGHALTLSGNLTNVALLTKSGAGVLRLTGTNAFAAATDVLQGVLAVNGAAALGGQGINLYDGAVLRADAALVLGQDIVLDGGVSQAGTIDTNGNLVVIDGIISGGGAGAGNGLTKAGPGQLTLNGSNSYDGETVLAQGTIRVGSDAALGNSQLRMATDTTLEAVTDRSLVNGIALDGNASVSIAASRSLALSGAIVDGTLPAGSTARLTKVGDGTLMLTGANLFDGGITVTAGRLTIGSGGALGDGGLTLDAGTTLQLGVAAPANVTVGNAITLSGGTVTFAQPGTTLSVNAGTGAVASDATARLAGDIDGTGRLALVGRGVITLAGTNRHGGTSINNSFVVLETDSAFGSGTVTATGTAGLFVAAGASRSVANSIGGTGLTIGGAGTLTFDGTVGGGPIEKVGQGTVVFNKANGFQGLLAHGGTIVVGASQALGNNDSYLAGPATVLRAGADATLGNGFFAESTLTVDTQGFILTMTGNKGALPNTGIVKTGSGTLVLGGVNSYTGLTNVTAGVLDLQGSLAGGVSVAANAELKGAGTAAGTVTIADGGTLSPGNSPGLLTFGSLVLNAGSTLAFDLADKAVVGLPDNDLIRVTDTAAGTGLTLAGTLTVSGSGNFKTGVGSFTLIEYGNLAANSGLTLGAGLGTPPVDVSYGISVTNGVDQGAGAVLLNVGYTSSNYYWNGGNLTPQGSVSGGSGSWDAAATNWSNSNGSFSLAWNNAPGNASTAVFGGTAGSVALGAPINVRNLDFAVGGYQITGPAGLTLTGNGTITVATGTATIDTTIGGAGASLTKAGPGMLILTRASGYGGGTLLDGGAIRLFDADGLGTGALTMAGTTLLQLATPGMTFARDVTLGGSATVDLYGGSATLSGVIGGSGPLNVVDSAGTGTLTLTGTSTYTGGTNATGVTLITASNANLGLGTGALTLTDASWRITSTFQSGRLVDLAGTSDTIDVDTGRLLRLTNVISGGAELVKAGGGTLELTNDGNSFGGGVRIVGGTVSVAAAAALGTGDIAFDAAGAGLPRLRLTATTATAKAVTLTNGGVIDVAGAGTVATFTGAFGGGGPLTKAGDGTLVLDRSGGINVIGNAGEGVNLAAGKLRIANADSLGTGRLTTAGNTTLIAGLAPVANGITLDNSIVLGAGTTTLDLVGTTYGLDVTSGFLTTDGTRLALAGTISGTGGIATRGAGGYGQLFLTGDNSYEGGTLLSGAQAVIASDTAFGTGGVTLTGFGAGIVNGLAGTPRSIGNTITVAAGALAAHVGGAGALTLAGEIKGDGALGKVDTGLLTLAGTSSDYNGILTVRSGSLAVTGSFGSAVSTVNIDAGATLSGNGTLGGTVNVATGGFLAPGASPGTLTVGNLNLAAGSLLNWQLGVPDTLGSTSNDAIVVTGNLTLDGLLTVTPTTGSTLAPGIYNLMTYGGLLTDNGLAISSLPAGVAGAVQTAVEGQINLVLTAPGTLTLYWDGSDTTAVPGIAGGSGVWNAASSNWTGPAPSQLNASWSPGALAVFAGPAGGAVTVNGTQRVSGLQFGVGGYQLSGGSIDLGAGGAFASVSNGISARIDSALIGGTLTKQGSGTLVLGGANDQAATLVGDGTLAVASSGALGSGSLTIASGKVLQAAAGGLDFSNAVTLGIGSVIDTQANTLTLSGVIGGGSLVKTGGGTLVLTRANGHTGGTAINQGTVQVGNNAALGLGGVTMTGSTLALGAPGLTIGNAIAITGNATVNTNGQTGTLSGVISGGSLLKTGDGTLVLTNGNGMAAVTVDQGTLAVTQAAALGTGTVSLNGTLAVGPTLRTDAAMTIVNTFANTGVYGIDTNGNDVLITGSVSGGGLDKYGQGKLTLANAKNNQPLSLYIWAGELAVTGGVGGNVVVTTLGTLSGTGAISGVVDLLGNATLAPGAAAPGTLSVGTLRLNAGNMLNWRLGQAQTIGGTFNDRVAVANNLTLDGQLNVVATQPLTAGIYNLMTYGGTLTDNGLAVASLPGGTSGTVQTVVTGQVNLLVTAPGTLTLYWDGNDTVTPPGAPTPGILGGPGTWNAANGNWTGSAGVLNASWSPGALAVFAGSAGGAVAVGGTQVAQGLQFATGGYTLSGGTLDLQVTSAGNPFVFVDANLNATIDSDIASTSGGVLRKTGAGRLTLGGTGSMAGTSIEAGTLRLTSAAALGGGGLAMADGTVLQAGAAGLSLGNAVTLAGTGTVDVAGQVLTLTGVIGGGALAVTDSAAASGDALILTGSNSYTGGTSVTGTTLQVSADANMGAAAGGLGLSNATLRTTASFASGRAVTLGSGGGTVDTQANTLTLTGVVAGSSLAKVGSGTLVLNGANGYGGGTAVGAGTIQVGSNAALGTGTVAMAGGTVLQAGAAGLTLANAVTLNGAATVDTQANALTLSGIIGGSGGMTKAGSGTLFLTGASTYTGATGVAAGTLNVSGSLVSAVTVQSGATLAGTGSVGSTAIQSGGTVSPGASAGAPGTLTVNGTLAIPAGATYAYDVTVPAADRIVVSGAATLGGTLAVAPTGTYTTFNATYTVLTAGSVGGTFGTVTGLSGFGVAFAPVVGYSANAVTLRLAPASLVTQNGPLTGNALEVAQAFDRAVAGGYNPQAFFPLWLQGSNLPVALNQLSGELHAAERRTLLEDTRVVRETAFDRLGAGFAAAAGQTVTADRGDASVGIWLRAAGSWGRADADAVGSRFTTDQRGFLTGIDYAKDGFTLGAMFHYTQNDIVFATLGQSRVKSTGGALYAGWRQPDGGIGVGAGGSIAGTDARGTRAITAPGLTQTLVGQYGGTSYQLFGELSYDLAPAATTRVEPFGRFAWARLDSKAVREAGGVAAVNGPAQGDKVTIANLGVRGAVQLGRATLSGSASWQRTDGDRAAATRLMVGDTGQFGTIRTVALDRDAAALQADISVRLTDKVSLGAGYSGVVGSTNKNHGARATLTVGF